MSDCVCGTCPFWEHLPHVKGTKPPEQGIIAPVGREMDLKLGACRGEPPAVVLMPFQAGNQVGMTPQYPDRITEAGRRGCHLHPDAPINNVVLAHLKKQAFAIEANEEMRQRFEANAKRAEGAMLAQLGVLRTLPEEDQS